VPWRALDCNVGIQRETVSARWVVLRVIRSLQNVPLYLGSHLGREILRGLPIPMARRLRYYKKASIGARAIQRLMR